MRSHIVKGESLTNKANEIGLINFIKLSKGTANLSKNRKHSILEGSIESIKNEMKKEPRLKITIPNIVSESLIKDFQEMK